MISLRNRARDEYTGTFGIDQYDMPNIPTKIMVNKPGSEDVTIE